jgi:hypothetical protein
MKKIQAIMEVYEGEEIAGMWVTPYIKGTGFYKLISKKRKDGKYEWAHFVQREDGVKEKVFTGEVDSHEQLLMLHSIISKQLSKIFGEHITLEKATYEMYTIDGIKGDTSVN